MTNNNLHEQQVADRDAFTQLIVQSTARYKIVVAGPGTGKSFTFKKLLETKNGKNLALTFINNLAFDLQKELGELADSYTFHSYCKKLLHRISVEGLDFKFHYFPKLNILVDSDAQYLAPHLEDFDEAFHNLVDDERIIFYLERGNYYNAVSHSDAVYRVLKYFQSGAGILPSYSQIVVDEYQDFNPLEVSFIDELAQLNPVLIAGDDDQAIYEFKHATPQHVREKTSRPDYTKYELPYCSRCTQVIVDAVHDVTIKAQSLEKLQGRIEKPYVCYLPDKEDDNKKYPKIIHASCSTHTKKAPYMSKFIEKEINIVPQEDIDLARAKDYPCVLILGPSYYINQIYEYLKPRFTNISYKERQDKDIALIEGYKLLLKDKESNLGWRIILEYNVYADKAEIIKGTHDTKQKLSDVIDERFKKEQLSIVSILERILASEEVAEDVITKVVNYFGCGIDELKVTLDHKEGEDQEETPADEDASISIKITTINGSKGLSANYVFLVGMNNTTTVNLKGSERTLVGFPKDSDNPTDNEISQFIVGITRTRKKCYLISNSRFGPIYSIKKSEFIDWIDQSRIENITVNADYFKN